MTKRSVRVFCSKGRAKDVEKEGVSHEKAKKDSADIIFLFQKLYGHYPTLHEAG